MLEKFEPIFLSNVPVKLGNNICGKGILFKISVNF